jgi:hypothetical protein
VLKLDDFLPLKSFEEEASSMLDESFWARESLGETRYSSWLARRAL